MTTRRNFLAAAGATLLVPQSVPRLGALQGPQADLLTHAIGQLRNRPQLTISRDPASLLQAVAAGRLEGTASHAAPALAGTPLVPAFATVTLPMGVYSGRLHAIAQLRDGDRIVLPRADADYDRARVLLYNLGLLYAHEDDGLAADFSNIVNPRKFALARGDASQLTQADLVVLPYDAAVAAGLTPAKQAVALEDGKSPYAQVLAVPRARLGEAWLPLLARAFQSREMRGYIFAKYGDSVETPW